MEWSVLPLSSRPLGMTYSETYISNSVYIDDNVFYTQTHYPHTSNTSKWCLKESVCQVPLMANHLPVLYDKSRGCCHGHPQCSVKWPTPPTLQDLQIFPGFIQFFKNLIIIAEVHRGWSLKRSTERHLVPLSEHPCRELYDSIVFKETMSIIWKCLSIKPALHEWWHWAEHHVVLCSLTARHSNFYMSVLLFTKF